MITLPDNWKNGIHFREWLQGYNQFGEFASLIIIVINNDKQTWAYQQSIMLPGIQKLMTKSPDLLERYKEDRLKTGYEDMLRVAPLEAAKAERALNSVKGWIEEPISNNVWEILPIDDLTLYKP